MLGFKKKEKTWSMEEELDYIANIGAIYELLTEGNYQDVLTVLLDALMKDDKAQDLEPFTKKLIQAAVAYTIIQDEDTEYETYEDLVKGFASWINEETKENN